VIEVIFRDEIFNFIRVIIMCVCVCVYIFIFTLVGVHYGFYSVHSVLTSMSNRI